MSENFLECTIGKNAADQIKEEFIQTCFALKIVDDNEIIHVFPPGIGWNQARMGARILECDLVSIACAITYEPLPYYQMYRSSDKLPTKTNSYKLPVAKKSLDLSTFKKAEIGKHALRLFKSTSTTTFPAIKLKDAAYIQLIFPRGTKFDDIATLAKFFDGDLVLVKARVNFKVLDLIKLESRYSELKRM